MADHQPDSGLGSWLHRALSAGIKPGEVPDEELQRIRLVNASIVGLVIVGVPFLFQYWRLGLGYMAVIMSATLLLSLASALALRHVRRPMFVANVVIGSFFVLLVVSNVTSGGFYDPNFSVFYVIPLAGSILMDLRAGMAWLGVVIVTALAFWLLPDLGVQLTNIVPQEHQRVQALANRLSALAGIGVLSAAFVAHQSRVARRLLATNETVRSESRSVDVMREVADAANAAATADEAAHRCIELLCVRTGWTAGRVVIDRLDAVEGPVVACYGEDLDPRELRARWAALPEDSRAVAQAKLTNTRIWRELTRTPEFIFGVNDATHGLRGCLAFPITEGNRIRGLFELYRAEPVTADMRTEHVIEHAAVQLLHAVDREQAQARIRDLVLYDRLTGLPNRDCFRRDLRIAQRNASAERTLAVLSIDIDRFDRVNDALGPAAGDELLRLAARRFVLAASKTRDQLRLPGSWTLARLAGDEFALMIGGLRQPADVGRLAQRLLDGLRAPMSIHNHELVVSASIGVAVFPQDGDDADRLLRNAHAAMVAAKKAAKPTYRFYAKSMNAADARRLELENELHMAAERNELRLVYQPIVRSRDGQVVGAEALLRWRRSNGEEVMPTEFIPIAETTGLVVGIGHWALRSACAQLRVWRDQGSSDMRIAVNISARQLEEDGQLVTLVERALSDHELPPEALELEITESTLMSAHDATTDALASLSAIGVGIALDDFGTGYSSLSYLQRFPVDRLKVDRSFVAGMVERASDRQLTRAIIAMAHQLRLEVVAEGVESYEHVRLLRALGCDELQGYLFGMPASPDEIDPLLGRSDMLSEPGERLLQLHSTGN